MTSAPLDVVLVVVTYQSESTIVGLLESLPAALAGMRADTIVVDNGSSDGTVAVLEGRADCRVIRSTNRGYAAGINTGVAAAATDAPILVLNPDCRLRPGCVPALVAALAVPGVGVVAPRVLDRDGTLSKSLRREPTIRRTLGLTPTRLPVFSEYVHRDTDYARPGTVDWALGAVLLIARGCYQAVGGLDESYFLFSEETDFCLRARDLGFSTRYDPSAEAVHIGGQSGRSARIYAMQAVNRVRLYRRRHDVVSAWLYFAVLVANEARKCFGANREWSRAAVTSLLAPGRRPSEIGCSDRLMPR